jgi:hypothetical protein
LEGANEEEDDSRNAIAIVNRRDEEVKSFLHKIIKFQRKEIITVNKKKDILMTIVLTLVFITLGSFSKTFQCTANNDDLEQYEKFCMNQSIKFNCLSNDKKDGSNAKICEEMA